MVKDIENEDFERGFFLCFRSEVGIMERISSIQIYAFVILLLNLPNLWFVPGTITLYEANSEGGNFLGVYFNFCCLIMVLGKWFIKRIMASYKTLRHMYPVSKCYLFDIPRGRYRLFLTNP